MPSTQLDEACNTLDTLVDDRFASEVEFLQKLVKVPTDTPPGDNAPNAVIARMLLEELGFSVEAHGVPHERVQAAGMTSITNLIVRHRFGPGPVIALNAHGDTVPPGPGWTQDPYGAEVVGGRLYGRGSAVSKSDFATYSFALLALIQSGFALGGTVELHFTYDEEFGGELGPGWLLSEQLVKPDMVIAAGFSYQVLNAHNGCLQLEVQIEGKMAHAAIPKSGVDALQGAVKILNRLYQENERLATLHSQVAGIDCPYLNVGVIEGGTNTNVVPGQVMFKLDRRMIPEEHAESVEKELRELIEETASRLPGISIRLRRILFAQALKPSEQNRVLAQALARQASLVFQSQVPVVGTPLYTDARLYAARGAAAALYGAGPRTILESNAKRADEHVVLQDLRGATKVIARTLFELMQRDAEKLA